MIIKIQSKDAICCFGTGCVIWITPKGSEVLERYGVKMSFSYDEILIGDYATMEEAKAVIEDICRLFNCGAKTYEVP